MHTTEELRRQLEDAGYSGSPSFFAGLKRQHRALLGNASLSPRSMALNGTPFLTTFNRVVIGAHGPYVEFTTGQCLLALETKKSQEWRMSGKYRVKYFWMNPVGFPLTKVYKQVGVVAYADYVIGAYYVDFYALS